MEQSQAAARASLMGPVGIRWPSDSANRQLIDDSTYSDLLGFAADAEIDLRDLEQLQHAQPVADVLQPEHEVVVMLEGLNLHLRDRFELGDFLLDGGEPRHLVLGESGQAGIMAGGLKFLQHANEAVLVDLG